jgi:hypothetical protein
MRGFACADAPVDTPDPPVDNKEDEPLPGGAKAGGAEKDCGAIP